MNIDLRKADMKLTETKTMCYNKSVNNVILRKAHTKNQKTLHSYMYGFYDYQIN